jgi:nucleoid DNA-binding protein
MMRMGQWFVLGVVVAGLSIALICASPVHSQRQPAEESFAQKLAHSAKLTEEQATRFLDALSPVFQDELKAGKTIQIKGLGTFRVVRIAEHKDMELGTGRPITVPASNTVEFVSTNELDAAANSANAKPAETVLPFQYNPLPGQTPSQKVGRTRVPPQRIR